jgi:membrane-bound lytic murein transglycosylase D
VEVVPPLRQVSFRASRRGDSVVAVAKRYRVTVAQVAAWNGTSAKARFKPGQAIVVMVPQRNTALAQKARGNAKTAVASRGKANNTRQVASGGRKLAKPGPTARSRQGRN